MNCVFALQGSKSEHKGYDWPQIVELAAHDPTYQDLAAKFVEHFLWIAATINRTGEGDPPRPKTDCSK